MFRWAKGLSCLWTMKVDSNNMDAIDRRRGASLQRSRTIGAGADLLRGTGDQHSSISISNHNTGTIADLLLGTGGRHISNHNTDTTVLLLLESEKIRGGALKILMTLLA